MLAASIIDRVFHDMIANFSLIFHLTKHPAPAPDAPFIAERVPDDLSVLDT
jgi:hypothetical protein